MNRSLELDYKIIFNVVFAIVIGIIFGNFVRNSMLNNDIIFASAYNYDDTVYILQTGIYYDETNARLALNDLSRLEIDGIIVKEHDKYFIYHQISVNQTEFEPLISKLNSLNINYFIKERQLMSMLSKYDSNTDEYEFYYQSITYYLVLLHDKPVTFTNDYVDSTSEVNLELYYNLSALSDNKDYNMNRIYQLYAYKSLVDLLL